MAVRGRMRGGFAYIPLVLLLVQLASIAFSFSHPQCLCVGVFMKRAACYDMPECGELEPKSWLHREREEWIFSLSCSVSLQGRNS